jgi:hypothetical protein
MCLIREDVGDGDARWHIQKMPKVLLQAQPWGIVLG